MSVNTEVVDAEQTARIILIESVLQDHSTRLRDVEDAILKLSTHTEVLVKASKLILGVVAVGLGLNVGDMSGVIS